MREQTKTGCRKKETWPCKPEWTMGDSWLNQGWLKLMKMRWIIYRQERMAKKKELTLLTFQSWNVPAVTQSRRETTWICLTDIHCTLFVVPVLWTELFWCYPSSGGHIVFRDSQSQKNLHETALENMRYIKIHKNA